MSLILVNNWGDVNFIGLNGIEIFDHNAKRISIGADQINLIAKNDDTISESDPKRLIDGIFMTKDKNKLWLVKKSTNSNPSIIIQFKKPIIISMIRIWNYNESRISSNQGVKSIII